MLSLVTMRAVPIWASLGQADARNFNVLGCMGSAASVGLGLALARPSERVLVIDGDGSLLMQLGSLVSIAEQGPLNLYHVVMENGTYETSGGQAIPGADATELSAVARAAGYRHAFRFDSVAELDRALPECLGRPGPVFVSLRITSPGDDPVGAYDVIPDKSVEIENMRRMLGVDQSG